MFENNVRNKFHVCLLSVSKEVLSEIFQSSLVVASVQRDVEWVDLAHIQLDGTTVAVTLGQTIADALEVIVLSISAMVNADGITASDVDGLSLKEVKEFVGHLHIFLLVFSQLSSQLLSSNS